MQVLYLALDAPLMSFGGVMVDRHGPTGAFPGCALLTGLLANGLGFDHRETPRLTRLQVRLHYAVREDVPGEILVDYQTVDLGQDHLRGTGWTTAGLVEERRGQFSQGTHIREREYLCGAAYTVALTLVEAAESPTLEELAEAMQYPARPLFIGRKPCLPSRPLYAGMGEAPTLREAVLRAPWGRGALNKTPVRVWYPVDLPSADGQTLTVCDTRDWKNQIHVGRRYVRVEQVARGEGT